MADKGDYDLNFKMKTAKENNIIGAGVNYLLIKN